MSEPPECCVLCGGEVEPWPHPNGEIHGWGHNPDPCAFTGRACDECNETRVIPARLKRMGM